jgi:hypothetical protein
MKRIPLALLSLLICSSFVSRHIAQGSVNFTDQEISDVYDLHEQRLRDRAQATGMQVKGSPFV